MEASRVGGSRDEGRSRREPSTINHQPSTINHLQLLRHFLQLRAEHSSAVAIKRDMEPVALFAFGNE